MPKRSYAGTYLIADRANETPLFGSYTLLHQDGFYDMLQPTVSVIIPVFGADALPKCLWALHKQTYPTELFEVIVVDNGTPEDLKPLLKPFNNVRLVREDKVGSYAARNKGVRSSRKEILAFTDADCIPNKDWLQSGVNRLTQASLDAVVGGKVSLLWKGDEPNPWERYDSLVSFKQETFINRKNYSVTANLMVSKEVFAMVGDFDESLRSGGDREWGRRAVAKGAKLIYCEATEVHHPSRSSFQQLRDKHLRLTGSQWSNKAKSRGKILFLAPFIEAINWIYFIGILLRQERMTLSIFFAQLGIHSQLGMSRICEHIRLAKGADARR